MYMYHLKNTREILNRSIRVNVSTTAFVFLHKSLQLHLATFSDLSKWRDEVTRRRVGKNNNMTVNSQK